MFGHVRGSFTGAITDTKGIFEQGHLGTVFLDEIGETSPALQVKMLRVLEENEVRPVGGTRTIRVDIRIVAATNADIEKAVAESRFRTDLYYRLGVITITMPPLRERREDIELLAEKFLRNACSRAQRTVADLAAGDDGAHRLRVARQRPRAGERRRAARRVQPRVDDRRRGPAARRCSTGPQDLKTALFQDLPTLDELERRYLRHVLDAVGGNRTRAAEVLGVDRRTLYRMAERFGIELKDD